MTGPLPKNTNFFTIRQQVKVETSDGKQKAVNAYTGNIGKLMMKLFGYQKCESGQAGSSQVYYIKKSDISPPASQEEAAQLKETTENMARGVKTAPSNSVQLKATPLTSEEKRVLKHLKTCELHYAKGNESEATIIRNDILNLCESVATNDDKNLAQLLTNALDHSQEPNFKEFCQNALKLGIKKVMSKSEDETGNIEIRFDVRSQSQAHNQRATQLEQSDTLVAWSGAVKSKEKVISFDRGAHLDKLIAKKKESGLNIDKEEFMQYFDKQVRYGSYNKFSRKDFESIKKDALEIHFDNYARDRKQIRDVGRAAEAAANKVYGAVKERVRNPSQIPVGTKVEFTTRENGGLNVGAAVDMRKQYAASNKQPTDMERACQEAHDSAIERVTDQFIADMQAKGFSTQIIPGAFDDFMLTITLTKK